MYAVALAGRPEHTNVMLPSTMVVVMHAASTPAPPFIRPVTKAACVAFSGGSAVTRNVSVPLLPGQMLVCVTRGFAISSYGFSQPPLGPSGVQPVSVKLRLGSLFRTRRAVSNPGAGLS